MSFPPPSAKQARLIWAAVTGLAVATLVVLVVICIWGMGQVVRILSPVVWPLAVGGVLAYLLDPVVDFLVRRGVPRMRAIIVVFAGSLFLVAGLAGSVVPQLVNESRELVQRIPNYAHNLRDNVEGWINDPPKPLRRLFERTFNKGTTNAPAATGTRPLTVTNVETGVISTNAAPDSAATESPELWKQLTGAHTFKSVADWLGRVMPKIGAWIASQLSRVASFFGLLVGLALIPIYAFYFLLEKTGIESHWADYLPVGKSDFRDELVFVIKAINDHLIAFFRGQVLVAICDGLCYTIGFLIIGIPFSALLGVMATVLTMIPFLGAIATCATALVIAFVQFGDWKHPLLVLAVFGVVQTLEGFVFQPKILGGRVGLHPLTIMIAVMVGTTLLGGILGGILAIPLTAAGKVLMLRYVWKKRPA